MATCTAAMEAVVFLGQNNLTEPIPLQTGFDFTVVSLLNLLRKTGLTKDKKPPKNNNNKKLLEINGFTFFFQEY